MDEPIENGTKKQNENKSLAIIAFLAFALSLASIAIVLVSSAELQEMKNVQTTQEQVIQRMAGQIYNQTLLNENQMNFNMDVVSFARNVTIALSDKP